MGVSRGELPVARPGQVYRAGECYEWVALVSFRGATSLTLVAVDIFSFRLVMELFVVVLCPSYRSQVRVLFISTLG